MLRTHLTRRLGWITLAVLAGIFVIQVDDAMARRRRGPSPAQKEAKKEAQQEKTEAAKALAKAQQAKDKEILKRFDVNKNGKIDGAESGPWDKFWRDVKLGNTPHPYSTIKIDADKDDKDTKKKK
jgi:hypothetical protein